MNEYHDDHDDPAAGTLPPAKHRAPAKLRAMIASQQLEAMVIVREHLLQDEDLAFRAVELADALLRELGYEQ